MSAPNYSQTDRRALQAVATQFFVNGAVFASFLPRLPEVRDRIGVSLDSLGLMITAALAFGLLGSVLASRLIGWLGTRWVIIYGAVVLTAAVPLIGVASGPLLFVAAYAVVTIADVLVDVSMNLQASWLSERRHVPVINRLHGLWSLGTVIGGVLAVQAARWGISLQTHLLVVSGVLILAVLFVGSGVLKVDETTSSKKEPKPEQANSKPVLATRTGLLLLGVAGAFSVTAEGVSHDWAAFRLADDLGVSSGSAGLGFVAFTVGMTVGRFYGDWATTKLGSERLLSIAIGLSLVALVGAGLSPIRWVVLLSYLAAGVGISTFFPRLYDEAARFKAKPGVGLAWLTGGTRVASLSVPSIVGFLAASRLSVGVSTVLVTLPCVLGLYSVSKRLSPRR